MAIGRDANALMSGIARGLQIDEALAQRQDRMEMRRRGLADQSWMEEQRGRQRRAWEQQDKATADAQQAKDIGAALFLAQNGMGDQIDPEVLKRTGFVPARDFNPNLKKWADTGKAVFAGQIQENSPEALEAINGLFLPDINRNVGKPYASDVETPSGIIPKGSVARSKKVTFVGPGRTPGTLILNLGVEVEKPDGTVVTYDAPLSAGGAEGEDPLEIPLQKFGDAVQRATNITAASSPRFMQEVGIDINSPETLRQLQAQYIRTTGQMPPGYVSPAEAAKQDRERRKEESTIKANEARARASDALAGRYRAEATGGGRGAAGGRGGADQQMVEYLKTNLFSNEPDNAKRTRMALDEVGRIKRLTQKSSGKQDFIARLIAQQAGVKEKDRRGNETLKWANNQQGLIEYAQQLGDAVYGSDEGGGAPSEREDYVTRQDDPDADLDALFRE